MSDPAEVHPDVPGFTPETLSVKAELAETRKPLATFDLGPLKIEARRGRDTLWLLVRRPGKGGVAMRTIPATGPVIVGPRRKSKNRITWPVESPSGTFTVVLRLISDELMRVTVSLKPRSDLLVAFWPRDIYPLDAGDDPTGAQGWVEAAQRGLNTGLCYFCVDKPAFGNVLYVQNLTALNPYFEATKTKPDGVVGGEWPELGYQPPTSPIGSSPPIHPLRKSEEVVISDALMAFRDACGKGEAESARQFIDMLALIYPHLDKPEAQFRDWMSRSTKTLADLARAPEATIEHYGHTYLHPYTGAEYPDSMVQLSVVAAMRDYERATGQDTELADLYMAGMSRFFDKELGIVRRYLPNVGEDKNKDAVDSWYLYHPLMNLGRLAVRGDAVAKRLFTDSLDYAVKAAKHFKYQWPIQYDVRDFSVITAARSEDGLGQTDVGGLYAYVMLQAYHLTDDVTYLHEAKTAIAALKGMRFELAYQTNLTAWGAVACIKLWQLEKDPRYLDQSLIFVANFLHNCELWDSQIEHAKHFVNFFGVTCLHDAPYMAAYECFESFAAFEEYLEVGGADIPPAARMLLCEFRRFTPDRGWYFYPDALPPEAVAKDNIRNGRIERKLSFPLEDLYGDGQLAGQVGQEIYGCGGAFVFAARAFFECAEAPFRIFTDYPAIVEQDKDNTELIVRLQGPPGYSGRVRVLKKGRRAMARITTSLENEENSIPARARAADFRDYCVPADAALRVSWAPVAKRVR
ncbi:MAG: hypothetical protein WAU68_05155 [Vitreimonas sp.]